MREVSPPVEEGDVAVIASTSAAVESTGAVEPPPPEDGEPVGPSAADEADMRDQGMTLMRYAPPSAVADGAAPLPSLESLVSKIPPSVRSALDEHLRARFVRVKRLRPGELK